MKIKFSKKQWEFIGKKAGWMKKSQVDENYSSIDDEDYFLTNQDDLDLHDLLIKKKMRPEEVACEMLNIPCKEKWEICECCQGEGVVDNPNLHSVSGPGIEGLSEDPDFKEEYLSGVHDVKCEECSGSGKIKSKKPKVEDARYKEIVEKCEEYLHSLREEKKMKSRGIQF